MVRTCCVKNCNIESDSKITCFRFPTSRILKRKWIDAIGLSNKLTANSLICIRHFHQDDYDIIRGRPRLKAKVIPSIFSQLENSSSVPDTEENSIESFTESNVNIDNNDKIIEADNDSSLSKESQNLIKDSNRQTEDKIDNSVTAIEKKDDRQVIKGKNDVDKLNKDKDAIDKDCEKIDKSVTAIENKDNRQVTKRKNDVDKVNKGKDGTDKDCEKIDKSVTAIENKDNRQVTKRKNDVDKIYKGKDGTDKDCEKIDKSVTAIEKEDDRQVIKEKNDVNKLNEDKDTIDKDCDKIDERDGKKDDVDERDRIIKSKPNGVICNSLVKSTLPLSNLDDLNKDIEEIITNYQIKQTRPVHHVTDTELEGRREESDGDEGDSVQEVPQSDPVFIEVSVQGGGDRAGSPRDCLMVLESVQVELDPRSFLSADGLPPDEDCHETVDLDDVPDEHERARSPQDPISLLTSSDDDEVIIQEPHIDTVEVSDETDEDDLPLVKLLKRKKKEKAVWSPFIYCMVCPYTTCSSVEYQEHISKHSTVLHVCEICDYTTASKAQFARHKRKHKDEKKYKCHLCDYKARHNMSLLYHLKSHRAVSSVKKGLKCDKCGFKSDVLSAVLKHVKLCTGKKFSCEKCEYDTNRASDLRRHVARRHTQEEDDDDVT